MIMTQGSSPPLAEELASIRMEQHMRAIIFLILFSVLAGCERPPEQSKSPVAVSNFDKRIQCAELAQSGKWEDLPDGPFLDETYYSPALDTCIFVMKQAFPAEKSGEIQNAFFVVDGLSRKQLWRNDPTKGETEDHLEETLNQELSKLQVGK
jgi:hypothetical protein